MSATASAWRTSGRSRSRRGAGASGQLASREAADQTAGFLHQGFEFAKQTFPDLWEQLTDSGRQAFVVELVRASFAPGASRTSELQRVIEAWYGTMLLRSSTNYEENMARAGEGELMTLDELRAELRL